MNMHILFVMFVLFGSFGCQRLTFPASWAKSGAKGCDLERIWSHTLDGLADLTESELKSCEAACKEKNGEACVGEGLLLYAGTNLREDKSEARNLFYAQCKANLVPGCVSSWLAEMNADVAEGRRFGEPRGFAGLERWCKQGERHACEALG
ncbi:MAG TPA: hypothetical protein PK156_49515, partial [Polyangium sp.]|nr:hypothetical protein [Polyangium sp.]